MHIDRRKYLKSNKISKMIEHNMVVKEIISDVTMIYGGGERRRKSRVPIE